MNVKTGLPIALAMAATMSTAQAAWPDKPVKLVMSSIDTIHSFYVPEFRLKADVVPNLYTTMWFQPTKEMESVVQCAEYCGTGHSTMLTRVYVMPSGDPEVRGP